MTRKGEIGQIRPPSFATTLPSAKLAWQWGQKSVKGVQRPRAGRAWAPQAPLLRATRARRASHWRALSQREGRDRETAQEGAPSRREPGLPGELGFVRHPGSPRPQN